MQSTCELQWDIIDVDKMTGKSELSSVLFLVERICRVHKFGEGSIESFVTYTVGQRNTEPDKPLVGELSHDWL